MAKDYIYAVARVRSLEMSLFSRATIEQLLAEKKYEDCIRFIKDKGWGGTEADFSAADDILAYEEAKTWKTVKEMVPDMSEFSVLTLPNVYHNLKSAIKVATMGEVNAKVFFDGTEPSGEKMTDIIKRTAYEELPESMRAVAKEAYESFLHTGDGQLCDIIIDRAALKAIKAAGEASKEKLLQDYARTYVDVSVIRIAVRSAKTGKTSEFMKRAMEPCSLNIDKLVQAALAGEDDVIDYLLQTEYKEAGEALKTSSSAFECWCDNQIIETIKPQKYNSFTIGAIVAYILARLNEIKTVRIVLSGKENHLPEDAIRERIREMYV